MSDLSDSSKGSSQTVRPFEVTHWRVVGIALPMTLAYLSTPILGIVDTGVVGQLGDAGLIGGLAVGAIIFDILLAMFYFLRASTAGFVAQAVGAGDEEQQRVVAMRSLLIALAGGIICLVLSPLILPAGLMFMNVTGDVAAATSAYFTIRVMSVPFTLINYSVLGWLLGQGRAGTGLALQTVLNGSNIVLSLWLGLNLGWGLDGVAIATVIAETGTAFLGLLLFYRNTRYLGPLDWPRILNREALMRLLSVNRDILIRSLSLLFAFAFFTAQSAKLGDNTLAANAILMNFFMVAGFLLDGFATAAEQLAGRAIGAHYRPAFDRSIKLTLLWGGALAAIASLIFWLGGPWLIDLVSTNETIRSEARNYLIWAALTAVVGVTAFQMDGVYIGATWSVEMRNMMLVSLVLFLATWGVAMPLWNNHGLWLAIEVFLGARGITLLLRLPALRPRAFPSSSTQAS